MNNPKYIIVHHTGGTDANPLADTSHHTFEIVESWHLQKGWNGIGYNWFIEKNGTIKKGRDEKLDGAHTIGYNSQSIGICLAGNFDATLPTAEQTASLKKLLTEKMAEYKIPAENIVPHRNFANKTCYGNKLSEDWARKLVAPIVESKEDIKKQIIALVNKL